MRVKSSGLAPGLANARPPGSPKFANAPPPGLTRRANAPSEARGGWVKLELTDALLKHLDKFKQICGLEINTNKTEALWLVCWRSRKDKPLGFKWPQEPVYALGIHFSYDLK